MRTANIAFIRLLGLSLATLCGISAAGAQVPVRIMPLGDSITAGFIPPSTYAGGYRERLYSLLTAPTEGFAVDYVGTLNYPGAVAEGWVDGDHEGHGGFKISEIRSQIPVWLKQVPDPDVILLKIGTNDFWSGQNVATTQDRLRSLIADLSALRPHAKIIVASLIPRYDAIETIQAQFNASLPGLVAAQAALGRKVSFVDMHAGFGSNPADIGSDGVHPTAIGHSKLADVWLPAIRSVITPLGTTAPPAIASVSARSGLQQVAVTFSKPINDADGANPANFSLSGGVSISQASLDASKRVVTLSTGTQLAAKLHTLTVSGVRDRLVSPNFIAPASPATFTSRAFIDGSFEQNDPAWVKQGTVSVQDATLQRATDGQKIVVFSGAEGANDGTISQSIPTIPNQKYRLQFDMGVYSSITSSQSLQLTVRDDVGGASGQILLSPPVASLSVVNTTGIPTTNWRILSYDFTAISTSTTVRFADASTVTSSVDLLLDDVRLEAVTNDAPVAINDGAIGTPVLTVAANSGASTPVAVLANDTDADNDSLTVTAAASPNGTVSIVGGQTLRFTPTLGFSGEATVTYTISDGKGGTSSATVWISVLVVGPFGNGSFENGSPVDFGIPVNWDATGSAISYSSKGFYVPPSGNGVWMVVFNPGNNVEVNRLWQTFSTVVGQTYTVTFDAGLAGGEGAKLQFLSAEVSGEVNPPGVPRSWPITSSDPLATWSEKSFTFTAGSSATTLTFTVDITGAGESAENVDLALDDVRVTSTGGINQAPIAVNDSYSTPSGTTLTVTAPGVLANDTDDTGPLTAVVDSAPNQGGSLTLNANGSFSYTPATGFSGTETFSYHASDGLLASTSATVSVTVNPVGAFANGSFENGSPSSFGTPQSWTAAGVVTYFDATNYLPAAGNGSWMAVFNPGGNTPLVSTLSQTFATVPGQIYTVAFDTGLAGGAGNKQQTLQAVVTGESTPPPTRSWPVTSTDPVATWSENSFNFTAGGTSATLTFSVDISAAGGAFDVDLLLDDVRITEFSNVNAAPVAAADAYSTLAGTPLTISAPGVLANDTDDTGPLTAVLVTPLNQGGQLTLNPDGSFNYTPANGFTGTETFTYRASDGLLPSATTTVTLTVTPIGPFANGSFENGSPTLFGAPQGWTASGVVTYFDATNYQPDAGNGGWMAVFNAGGNTPLVSTLSQTFATVAGQLYRVEFDARLASGAGTKQQVLLATVAGETNPPGSPREFPLGSTVPAPAWEPDLDFTFTATGTAVTLTFTVDISAAGAAFDVDLLLDDVRVTAVSTINEAPVAAADSYSTQAGTTLTVAAPGVLGNDTDDNGPLTAVVVTPLNQGGSLTLNANGSFSYTPANGFSGTETFSYHASDGTLSSAVTTVTLTVTPIGPFGNGGFETAAVIGTAPQSWTAAGVVTYFDATNYLPATGNGSWMVVFNPGGNTPLVSTLSQTFATVPGQIYTVAFDTGLAGGAGNKQQTLQAVVTGESTPPPTRSWPVTSTDPVATWSENSFNFTAGGTSATLTFSVDISAAGGAFDVDLLLDDVRITEFSNVNAAPVAAADAYSTLAGTPLTISAPGVLANDTDDTGPLTAVLVTPLNQGGQLTLNPDGSFNYTPANGFTGTETFTYRASDGLLPSATTTVTLTVTPIGPFANGSFENGSPTLFGAPQGWTANGVVTYFDATNYQPDPGNGGWMAVFNAGGNTPLVSTLSQTFATVAGQLYRVEFDARLASGAGTKQQVLLATVAGETNPPGSPREFPLGSTVPAPAWEPDLDFTFTATGTAVTLTFTVDISAAGAAFDVDLLLDDVRVTAVSTINEAPVAAADSYSTQAGTTLTVAAPGVLGNDTDDNGPLTAVVVTPLNQGGSLTLNANGSFSYTPANGFSGTETFSYHASDGTLSSAVTTVTLTVTPIGPFGNGGFETAAVIGTAPQSWTAAGVVTYFDATNYLPATGNGSWMVVFNPGGNTPLVSTLSQTFATVPGQIYTVAFDTGLAGGAGNKQQTLQAVVTGESTPPPTRSWPVTSTDPVATWSENSFNFTAGGTSATLTFSVDISAAGGAFDVDLLLDDVRVTEFSNVNAAPVAAADAYSTLAGTPLTISAPGVLANDTDDTGPLTAVLVTPLNQGGQLTLNPDGSFNYTPANGFTGTETFTYRASDGLLPSATTTVTLTVTPIGPFANGSFENGSPTLFGAPQGWTASGVVTYFDATNYQPDAGNGGWMAVFNAGGNTPLVSTLSQTFATVAGQLYRVEFDARLASGAGTKQQVLLATVAGETNPPGSPREFPLGSTVPAPAWEPDLDFTFTATGTAVTLTFTVDITAAGGAFDVDLLLDDVRVTAVSTVNEAPVAAADSYSTQAGTTLTVAAPGVLANDTDDNGPLTAVVDSQPNQGGSLTLNANGGFSYTPANGFSGTETFSYHASDGALSSAVTTVTLTVTPIGPFGNGGFETAAVVGTAPQGWTSTGVVTYADAENYLPAAGNGSWMVVFNPGGNTPLISTLSQTFATTPGQIYTVAFDTGLAGGAGNKQQTLQAVVTGESTPPPTRSWAVTSSDEVATWSEKSFNFTAGGASATLTFSVDISAAGAAFDVDLLLDDVRVTEFSNVNAAPVAAADAYSTLAGTLLTISAPGVLANDTDDTGPLTAVLVTAPNQGGQLTLNPDGSFNYTPANGFTGTETFTYGASDGALPSATTTVTLTVTPIGPFANGSFENGAPTLFGAPQGWTANGVVTYFDATNYQPDPGNGGWMAVFNAGGNTPLVSTLSQTFATVAGQLYRVEFDARLASGAGTKQQVLLATVAGETNPPGSPREFPLGSTVAAPDWERDLDFTFTATGTAVTLTFTVDISAAGGAFDVDLLLDEVRVTADGDTNLAPVATNDGSAGTPFITVTEDSGASAPIAVLSNDNDPNLDSLTVIQASSLNGTVIINGGQTLTFNPTSNYNGTATISYTISDGHGGTASAVVFVLVTPVNDAPVAVNDGTVGVPFVTVMEDSGASASINVLSNDMDIELNPLTVSLASSPNGTVVVNGNQTLSFNPSLNFNGPTTISYTISDGKGGTASATAYVSVTPVNDAPVANPQSVTVNEDGSIGITLTGSDADGNALTFAVGTAAHGSVSLSGSVATYTPEANYSGPDSFTFTATDGFAVSTAATVSITVTGLAGNDFNQWLAANLLSAGVGADSDADSVCNAVEYVIGGDPKNHMDAGLLPTISRVSATVGGNPAPANYLLFTYRRTDRSKNDPSAAIKVQWNNGLSGTWTDAAGSPGVVVVGENDGFAPGVDRIKVYLPLSLAAGGKFFTRLGVDISGAEPDE